MAFRDVFLLAGIVILDCAWPALLPAGIYLLIHIAEGETITPMLLAKRFTLNPVLVIVSVFFWHFLWGTPAPLSPCRCSLCSRSSATA